MASKKNHDDAHAPEHKDHPIGHRAVDLHTGKIDGHKPSIELQYLHNKVEKYLKEFGLPHQANKRGEFVLTKGHAAIVLALTETPDGNTFIDMMATVAKDVHPKAKDELKLYKTILQLNVINELGKFALVDDTLQVKYRLLGNELDRDELAYSVLKLLKQAEHLPERVEMLLSEKEPLAAGSKKK